MTNLTRAQRFLIVAGLDLSKLSLEASVRRIRMNKRFAEDHKAQLAGYEAQARGITELRDLIERAETVVVS